MKRATIYEQTPASRPSATIYEKCRILVSAWRSVACPLPRMIISPPWLLIGVPSCSP